MIAAIIPLLCAGVVLFALYRGVDVYEAFLAGAKEGLPVLYKVLPAMGAMLVAIELLRASGLMEGLTGLLNPLLSKLGMPPELLPLALLRPFSGSAAMAIVADLFKVYGPDSLIGLTASAMMGSSETIFYTIAMYFGAVGVKKTRFTLPVALLATFVSVVASVVICRILYA